MGRRGYEAERNASRILSVGDVFPVNVMLEGEKYWGQRINFDGATFNKGEYITNDRTERWTEITSDRVFVINHNTKVITEIND